MLNKEVYKDKIMEIACNGESLALDRNTNELTSCSSLSCSDCVFSTRYGGEACSDRVKAWANSQYVPVIDWSNLPVNTPLRMTLKTDSSIAYIRHYAGKCNGGRFYVYGGGTTSYTYIAMDESIYPYELNDYTIEVISEKDKEAPLL